MHNFVSLVYFVSNVDSSGVSIFAVLMEMSCFQLNFDDDDNFSPAVPKDCKIMMIKNVVHVVCLNRILPLGARH